MGKVLGFLDFNRQDYQKEPVNVRVRHWDEFIEFPSQEEMKNQGASIFELFDINPTGFDVSYDAFLKAIHPDDRDAVNAAYLKSLRDKLPYRIEHRLLMNDGRI